LFVPELLRFTDELLCLEIASVEAQINSMNFNQLYADFELEHYAGYTLVTLRDKTDDDFAFVFKKGKLTHKELQSTESGEPTFGLNYATRELARADAMQEIDLLDLVAWEAGNS
jgi:hypothetical protein